MNEPPPPLPFSPPPPPLRYSHVPLPRSQRLDNGNTLVTMGPQGIAFEVTPAGEEVWRYVSPVINYEGGVAFVRQGEQRVEGRFSLFRVLRYSSSYKAFTGKW